MSHSLPTAGCFLFSFVFLSCRQQPCSDFNKQQQILLLTLSVSSPPLRDGEAAPAFSSQTLCFRNTMFCTLVKKEISSLVLLVIFFLSAVCLISCCLKYHWTPSFLFLSLCSLAAWLRLHLWAGFQRAAVWSSHITWLQDALSFTVGTLVPRWVQLLSTRGRQRRSHDHRQMHSGTETHRGRN